MTDQSDGLDKVWQKFMGERNPSLFSRFSGGPYRAVVRETNDPLNQGRVRVFIPDLHELAPPDKLPWAVVGYDKGGKGAGDWHNFTIGDLVWVAFERGHPYNIIVIGAADPSRIAAYPNQSIHTETPLRVRSEKEQEFQTRGAPDDFIREYLPQDNRPMSWGSKDRYGNFVIYSSVGFFPKEHKKKSAPAGTDGVSQQKFNTSEKPPVVNDPDLKYVAYQTKYGHSFILSDIGYTWDQEFKGDFNQDFKFESDRGKYLLRLYSENEPKERDQRRIEMRSRYGHKFEFRDVGWEQNRPGEYTGAFQMGDGQGRDERWFKTRTKAGFLLQAIDTGSDPVNNINIRRLLKTEVGATTEKEDQMGDDRRMWRMITPYGYKFVLDDRGSDARDPVNKEEPRGNGFMVKGVRNGRGFGIEFNEKDSMNRMMLYSPKGKTLVIDDKHEHITLCTDTSTSVSEEVTPEGRYTDNHFATTSPLTWDFEANTWHLKLDKENRYLRLKTPQQAGIESRDGDAPCGSWTESRDNDGRAVFMSRSDNLLVIRDKEEGGIHKKFIALDDNTQVIIIKNIDPNGKIQIVCPQGFVDVIAEDVRVEAEKTISMKAGREICLEAAGSQFVVRGGHVGTNTELRARDITARTLTGTHTAIQIPLHPLAPAPPGVATSCSPQRPDEMPPARLKPLPFDTEEGCAPNKVNAGPISPQIRQGGGGGGGGGGSSPPPSPPTPAPPSSFGPAPPVPFVPDPPQADDPLEPSGGCVWYGCSTLFLEEIEEFGLRLNSLVNDENVPDDLDATRYLLATTLDIARGLGGEVLKPGLNFAPLSKARYGGASLIIRVNNVPDLDQVVPVPGNPDIVEYTGDDIPFSMLEIFEIGTDEFTSVPEFPEVFP